MTPHALLINPWIYDFAAYDLWAFPLGLLYLSAILKKAGWRVSYLDCTSRVHPSVSGKVPPEKPFHTGKYYAEEVEKPQVLEWVHRRFRRYGIPEEAFIHDLDQVPAPDVVLVSSRMTYWYPGVKRVIEMVREFYPSAPIILGGVYASLCPDHARRVCRPDVLFKGEAEARILPLLHQLIQAKKNPSGEKARPDSMEPDDLPFPDYGILPDTSALPLETSRGCPYHCTYCASNLLVPRFRRKSPGRVADEIEFTVSHLGAEDFAFYDDALLFRPAEHFLKIAGEVIRRKIQTRFHTPNSIFASEITPDVAWKMKEMGFTTIRISLETTNLERLRQMNRRILPLHFEDAVRNLHRAGFAGEEIGVYIMVGLPGQEAAEVRAAVDYVIDHGCVPRLSEFSPIPGTGEWSRAARAASMDINKEPLLHNNTIYHLIGGSLGQEGLDELKHYSLLRLGKV